MPKLAANLSMMFNEVDFLDRFAAAARAGFTGVEYLFPYGDDKDQLADLLAAHGLTQALHNLPAAVSFMGPRGSTYKTIVPGKPALQLERRARGEDHGPFDYISKLPYITRPIISSKGIHRSGGDLFI